MREAGPFGVGTDPEDEYAPDVHNDIRFYGLNTFAESCSSLAQVQLNLPACFNWHAHLV